jgi:hypothetical protein
MAAPAGTQAHDGSADSFFPESLHDTMHRRSLQQSQYLQQQAQYINSQYGQQPLFQQQPQQQYPDQPPTYSQQPVNCLNEKTDFNQTFRVDKPKYNDIWAALLFLATFAGFVVVSAFAIQGYSATKLFQGGSIYRGPSTVGLSTNTIILL